MTNPLNTYDSEWFTVDQLSPRDFIANMEKGMNEHDEYLRTRPPYPSECRAFRWAVCLLAAIVGISALIRLFA